MEKKIPFELLKILPAEDGSPLGMTVEVQPEFEEWFVKAHGLSEWDEEKFSVWFKDFHRQAMRDNLSGNGAGERSDQQQIDIWDNGDGSHNG
jgi:hypothetical protein